VSDLHTDHQRRQSPLLLRRYLARRIVERRENAGLSQGEVAKHVRGISKPKLQYLELAKRALQDDDLVELLRLFEVPTPEHGEWLELARDARAKGRYDHYDVTDLPPAAKLAADYEWGARRLRVFSGSIVPALLQTPDYTADLVAVHRAEQSPEQIASAVEVRRLRQEALSHSDPVEFHAIVDQAALERTAHGVEGAAAQLEHIADVAGSRPNVTFQVVPWSTGHYRAQAGGFVLMDFGLPDHPGLLQVEPALVDPVHVDDRREIYLHSRAFDEAAEVALSPDETIDLLHSVAGRVKGATGKGTTHG
jgi:transcriptional regulator with XRE-family HTH domain